VNRAARWLPPRPIHIMPILNPIQDRPIQRQPFQESTTTRERRPGRQELLEASDHRILNQVQDDLLSERRAGQ